ncbi:MAG: hypothetical protein ACRDBG_07250 [Waterburya sp.]
MKVTIKVSRPPTRNESERLARGNKYGAAQVKAKWTQLIYHEIHAQTTVVFVNPVNIVALFEFARTNQDPDNIISSLKYVLDGMTKTGLILNDTVKEIMSINCSFARARDTKNPKIILTLDDTLD